MRRWGPCLLVLIGCGDNIAPTAGDGGPPTDGQVATDAPAALDGAPPLSWIDFSASGCDLASGSCSGPAPLRVTFHALSPSPIEEYRWRFGEGDPEEPPNQEAIPTHTYALPGSYDVSLAANGPGGSNSASKTAFIEVVAAGLGAQCELDEQCAADECICNEGDCSAPLANGLCSARCDASSCTTGVCADLRPGAASEDWHDLLCLDDCSSSGACPSPLACQSLRAKDGGWISGCFPANLLAAVGRSCTDDSGAPDDDRCASGDCEGEGARGMCSADCDTTADCPAEAACATFGGPLGKRCLARCDASFACDSDPWLACEPPGITADKGFTVDEVPIGSGYCAPKRCTVPADCGSQGACVDSYCAPPP